MSEFKVWTALTAGLGAVQKWVMQVGRRKPMVKLKICGELEIEAESAAAVSVILEKAARYRQRTTKFGKPQRKTS